MNHVTQVSTPVAHLVGPGKLKVAAGRLAFSAPGREPLRLDPAALHSVFCYGSVGVTDDAMEVLFRHGVEVAWMTRAGFRCRGRLVGRYEQATHTRIMQHQVLSNPGCKLAMARQVVEAKIASQIQAARHYQRQGCGDAGLVLTRLAKCAGQCRQAPSLDSMRGIEGNASCAWFELFGRLLNPPWQFVRRVRRPPTDPVNALLSLAYTWLTNRATARGQAHGLEVNLGALHDYRPGRPSLACDLVEPLRVPTVDRWVIKTCNRNEVAQDDFVRQAEAFALQPKTFGRVMTSWERHWAESDGDVKLEAEIQRFVNTLRQLHGGPSEEGQPRRDGEK